MYIEVINFFIMKPPVHALIFVSPTDTHDYMILYSKNAFELYVIIIYLYCIIIGINYVYFTCG